MSLLEITKLATAENSAIHLHPSDNIAVARVPLSPGQVLKFPGGLQLRVSEPVPAGHKVALAAVGAGENLVRYGQIIGRSSRAIEPGQHVHVHNLSYEEIAFQYEFPNGEIPYPELPSNAPTFLGYPREDGRAGTRNYLAIVAASNCAAHTAQLVADSFLHENLPPNVDGVVAFPHGEGCGMGTGPDLVQLRRTLSGVLDHPNVSGAIILGLGCEVNQISHYLGEDANPGERLKGFTLQNTGGTTATMETVRREIYRMMERAREEKRVEVPASKIILGLNCGGSDSFSGITANPALGWCSDELARMGATSVLAETTEIFGAEHLLVKRSRNRAVAERLLSFVDGYKRYLRQFEGSSFNDNPSPGNKEGGLTNIIEKSLGAVIKAGTSPLMEAVDYSERIHGPGFVFMNTPGYDPASLSGLAAGGCNIMAFTTGRGSAIGFPTLPVIKISSNSSTYRRMTGNMDINAGRIADGDATVEEVGKEILEMVLRVASGEQTCAEILGHKEFVPWRIGPTL